MHNKTVKLNDNYKAEVSKNLITVGCQKFTPEAIHKLHEALLEAEKAPDTYAYRLFWYRVPWSGRLIISITSKNEQEQEPRDKWETFAGWASPWLEEEIPNVSS